MDGADKDRGALGAGTGPDSSPEASAGSRGGGGGGVAAAGSPAPSSGPGATSSGKRSLDSVSREELMVLVQKLNKQLRAANQRADGGPPATPRSITADLTCAG